MTYLVTPAINNFRVLDTWNYVSAPQLQPGIVTVTQDSTAVTYNPETPTAQYGQPISITVNVTTTNGVIPTGQVKFAISDSSDELTPPSGTPASANLSNGTATWSPCSQAPPGCLLPAVGSYQIVAEYEGDTNDATANGNGTLEIQKADTSTVITNGSTQPASLCPISVTVGNLNAYIVTVRPAVAQVYIGPENPTGNVSLTDVPPSGVPNTFGPLSLTGDAHNLSEATAPFQEGLTPEGGHTLTAAYLGTAPENEGDANYNASNSSECVVNVNGVPIG